MTLLLFLACSSCGVHPTPVVQEAPTVKAPADAPPLLLVLSLDTTRADALGLYGGPDEASPNLDALAEQGVVFDWAFSHTSTTLNSHSSLWSGLDPHGHGVPRNGFVLSPAIDTVPERLHDAGWDTLAVVAASAVDRSTNLQSGFRIYDDKLDNARGPRFEAPGDAVTERALALVDQRDTERPLLLWVHYYDAHSPYEAAPEWNAPFVDPDYVAPWGDNALQFVADGVRKGDLDPAALEHLRALYQGEVRFMDHQIGLLLEGLAERGLLEDGYVVVVADHGEMFGEERSSPVGHGPDIDLAITHIPSFVVGLGEQALVPARVEQPVALSDIGSTLVSLAGLDAPLGAGRDLSPLLQGSETPSAPIFLEASSPWGKEGPAWNNSETERGVVDRGAVYVRNPWQGTQDLYALEAEQPELDDDKRRQALRRSLAEWDDQAPPFVEEDMSPAVREALQALGYLE
ncbi:MAG: sulfatase [Myxococcota bacterium]|nr:sulfatase [Myxococcota bacterium]